MADQYSRDREAVAKIEIGHTAIGRFASVVIVWGFLLLIFGIPLVQSVSEVLRHTGEERKTSMPATFSLIHGLSSSLHQLINEPGNLTTRIFAANRVLQSEIDDYETRIEDASIISRLILPPTQYILSGLLGAGNEKVVCGREGWLFYRPDIEYLIGPGFMEPGQLEHRIRNESVQPDPVRAICSFNDELIRRGITLVLLPVPVKPMVNPEKLYGGYESGVHFLQNPSFSAFVDTLRNRGIEVFDFRRVFDELRQEGRERRYLRTDSHWRPEIVEYCAGKLATLLDDSGLVTQSFTSACQSTRIHVSNIGDIAEMLRLPPDQTLYTSEEVSLRSIRMPDGSAWSSQDQSEVLFLGDSFSNIYSLGGMGWGESAGLVEQLSYELGQPIEAIIRNDNGSYATRKVIYDDAARGRDRLEGKRVVIYQFAVRELSMGDWKVFDFPVIDEDGDGFFCPDPGDSVHISATIKSISSVPEPYSVPYRDHIISIHLVDVRGVDGTMQYGESLVYMWSMRDNVLTAAASLGSGQRIRLTVSPWSGVSETLDRYNRSELTDTRLWSAEPCWGYFP